MTSLRTSAVVLAALAVGSLAGIASCSESPVEVGDYRADDAGENATPFTPTSEADGGNADASLHERVLACVGTQCPAPYTTCPGATSIMCGTNLLNDPDNCGACGHACNSYIDGLNMGGRCVDGACTYECVVYDGPPTKVFRDCNNLLDDGCESDVQTDRKHCGTCGHKCADGERCHNGACGCPSGKTDCDGECVDTRTDDENCKTCGNVCHDPAVTCNPMPPHTAYGCAASECGALKCQGQFKDCDDDLRDGCSSNGCETLTTDRNNCGGCGIVCTADENCTPDSNGNFRCVATCESAGLVACTDKCADLSSDPENCGVCGNVCLTEDPTAHPHQIGACRKGLCSRDCAPGFADCNGDPGDGCEVELKSNPANCGACGNQCNMGAGQPCVEGQCLMVECDAGPVTK
jgi:hypothetical protein